MTKSDWLICEIDLEDSYGVVINLAIIDKNGKHELVTDNEPSHIICEKCWERKEDYISEILELV